jgi:hypothetical protein
MGRAVSQDLDRKMAIVAHSLFQFPKAGDSKEAGPTPDEF